MSLGLTAILFNMAWLVTAVYSVGQVYGTGIQLKRKERLFSFFLFTVCIREVNDQAVFLAEVLALLLHHNTSTIEMEPMKGSYNKSYRC